MSRDCIEEMAEARIVTGCQVAALAVTAMLEDFDVPAINAAAIALAERHRTTSVFETARMYTREQPALAIERVFGVTSFELG